jgi:hypothetical protein
MWLADRMNGLAKLFKGGKGEPQDVIYKDDMLI